MNFSRSLRRTALLAKPFFIMYSQWPEEGWISIEKKCCRYCCYLLVAAEGFLPQAYKKKPCSFFQLSCSQGLLRLFSSRPGWTQQHRNSLTQQQETIFQDSNNGGKKGTRLWHSRKCHRRAKAFSFYKHISRRPGCSHCFNLSAMKESNKSIDDCSLHNAAISYFLFSFSLSTIPYFSSSSSWFT